MEGHLHNGTFDLHIYKTDGLYHVLPDSLITYTIYFSMTSGPAQTFYIIDRPPAAVTPMGNTAWLYLGGGDWRYPATDVITFTSGQSLSTTFTVSVPLAIPYGTQLDNRVSFSLDPDYDATPLDNTDTDTDIVVPGFNFSYLPLVTKAYAP